MKRAALPLVLLLAGCVSPSRTDEDFRLKAGNSAKAVASSISTALLAADAAAKGKGTGPYFSVLFGEMENDAESVQSQFDSVQPPSSAADRVRDTLDKQLSDAVQGLQQLRITVRRGELTQLPDVAKPLHDVLTQLDHLAQEWS